MTKPPMPDVLIPMADAALQRHRKRRFMPELLDSERGYACPYAEADEGRWWALMFDIFGTRMTATVAMFFRQLGDLLRPEWDDGLRGCVVDGDRMAALLTMVQAMKPRDEAQAALAAQLVALHLNSMNLAQGALRYSFGDPRSVAVLAKATRAYGDGLAMLKRLQGKGGHSKQTIKVEKHVYYQQNNYGAGGGAGTGGQPHAAPDAGIIEASAALPSQGPVGEVMPIASGQRQARLSDARGQEKRSAEG